MVISNSYVSLALTGLFFLSRVCEGALPPCLSNSSICNAVIRFPDKVIDQGVYCSGCPKCSVGNNDDDDDLDGLPENSFIWQHFEHPRMKVQFIQCQNFRPVQTCGPNVEHAAVFSSPVDYWELELENHNCACPPNLDRSYSLYHLKSWQLENERWKYYFSCDLPTCQVESPSDSVACARKSRIPGSSTRNDVTFLCHCPNEYHCTIYEEPRISDENGAGSEIGSVPESHHSTGRTWYDGKLGREIAEKICQLSKTEETNED